MKKQNDRLSLWGINEEIFALEQLLEMELGEISEEYEQLQKEVESQLILKVDSYVGLLKSLKHELVGVKQESDELIKYGKIKANKIERIENMMKTCLMNSESKIFTGTKVEIKLRKPVKVLLITDENIIPEKYIQTETVIKIDNVQIKKDLKLEKVEGCELIDGKIGLIIGLKK